MKIIDRVFQYIEYKGIKPIPFEKEIGLSNGYLGKQQKRNADLGESIILKIIENCLEINPYWLLTGQGEMLKSNTMGDIRAGGDVIGSGIVSNSTIKVSKGLTTEEQVQQENLKLHYEIKMRDREIDLLKRENNLLERDVASYKDALEQVKSSQDMIKELYERKIEDLKRTIRILETQMESNNKNQM